MTDLVSVLSLNVGDIVNVWSDVYKTIKTIRKEDQERKVYIQYTDGSWGIYCYNKQTYRREDD